MLVSWGQDTHSLLYLSYTLTSECLALVQGRPVCMLVHVGGSLSCNMVGVFNQWLCIHNMQPCPAHDSKACKTDLSRACLQVKPWPAEFMRAASELWACENDSWTVSVFKALQKNYLIVYRPAVQGIAGEVWGSVI